VPVFAYSAVDNTGKRITGNIEAATRDEVVNSLQDKDLIITKITRGTSKTAGHQQVMQTRITIIPTSVKSEDLMIFTRELATMVNAGLPLVECLFSLAEDLDNEKLKKIVHDMGAKIIGGMSFSDALKLHSDVFDSMYINLVKVGEIAGNLEVILMRLADYIESTEALKKKVVSAMYYPATVLSFAFLVVMGLFTFVLPKFAEVYVAFGSDLPLPTKILLQTAGFFGKYAFYIIIIMIGAFIGISKLIKTSTGRLWFDNFKLTIPVIGAIVKKVVIARFARTLSLLYSSGVPIIESLDLVANSCGNSVMEKAILRASEQVLEGERITGTLDKSGIFPNMVIHMIDVGERTGTLSDMLQKISEFYDMQVEAAIAGLTSIIEPILIVVMGVLIGIIAVCLFLPIVKLPTIINTA